MSGLEDHDAGFGTGVDLSLSDRHRWQRTQRYRPWKAKRKYKAFESKLLQHINEKSILNAVKTTYSPSTASPTQRTWKPWKQTHVDVPSYEIKRKGSDTNSNSNCCFIVPFTHSGRPIVTLPQFMKKQLPREVADASLQATATDNNQKASDSSKSTVGMPLKATAASFYSPCLNQRSTADDDIHRPRSTAPSAARASLAELPSPSDTDSNLAVDDGFEQLVQLIGEELITMALRRKYARNGRRS
ncbi:hypothetical protein EDB81DRAFT_874803 [Dactylonectria macrodidyma]|uniref:Neuraminidase-like domain-containing protein n=1 Tax=Dactylonectria macrodidyma TaxID=307937 RepID=A0A9P9FUW4_9HYPO|nr:hypothetical protein EDB81DRAFT_874803 [Dactylonectria macrodidyma]